MLNFQLATYDNYETWHQFRLELYEDLDPAHSEDEIKRMVEDPNLFSYLVYKEGILKPIGMVEMSLRNIVDGCISSPVAYIDGLYIIEQFQGQGLGKELMTFIKKWSKEQGCTELAVDTEPENERAQKFYLREGFEETFRIVQFKMAL